MKLITLPPGGELIDLDSVGFVGLKQNNAGNCIKVVVQGFEQTLMGEAATTFLKELNGATGVDTSRIDKWITKKKA